MLLYILCIYLSLYFNVHIIVVGLYCCVCFPRWVLDHLLGYVREVPLGGRNLIPPKHLGILLLMLLFYVIPFTFKQSLSSFILCHPIYFQAISIPFYFMSSHLISCMSPLPLYFIARTYIYLYIYTLYLDT